MSTNDSKACSLDFTLPALTLPIDSEGFVQSFDGVELFLTSSDVETNNKEDSKETNNGKKDLLEPLSAFFDTYGFCVIRNVFSKEDCTATRDAMWTILESSMKSKKSGKKKTVNKMDQMINEKTSAAYKCMFDSVCEWDKSDEYNRWTIM